MKPVCLIAARKNSKGVPNKNIESFLGKPLISYAIKSSIKSKIFQSVVVSTENEQIAKIFGCTCFLHKTYLKTTKMSNFQFRDVSDPQDESSRWIRICRQLLAFFSSIDLREICNPFEHGKSHEPLTFRFSSPLGPS